MIIERNRGLENIRKQGCPNIKSCLQLAYMVIYRLAAMGKPVDPQYEETNLEYWEEDQKRPFYLCYLRVPLRD